jgi:hypothetical protein
LNFNTVSLLHRMKIFATWWKMEGRVLNEYIKNLPVLYRTSRFIRAFTQCFTECICVQSMQIIPSNIIPVLFSFNLSIFFRSFLVWSLQDTHGRYRELFLYLIKLTDTHTHSVVLLWARDQPVAETSDNTKYLQVTVMSQRNSNPQSQRTSAYRATSEIALLQFSA